MELNNELGEAARESRGTEGDGEGGEGHCYREKPFVQCWEEHWVSGVGVYPVDGVGIFFSAGAGVVVFFDCWGEDALVEDHAPLRLC